jgi:hypothetical protein
METAEIMNEESRSKERYAWAGPALFFSVLLAVIVFFVWFLS